MGFFTPKSRALRHFFALSAGNYGALVLGLAVNALLTRRLGADQYGSLALMLMASQVLLLLAVNWTHAGFVRFGAEEYSGEERVSRTLAARLGILLPAVGTGAVVLVLGRVPIARYLEIPAEAIWWILLHFVGIASLSLIGGILQASDRMSQWGICLFLDKFVVALSLFLLPSVWIDRPVAVLMLYGLSSSSVAIWAIWSVGWRSIRPVLPGRALLGTMVSFSAPLFLSSWAGLFGTNWFDLVILKAYVSVTDIGLYSLATQLSGVVQQVTIVFSTLLLPRLSLMVSRNETDRIISFLRRLLPYWVLGTTMLFSVGIVVADPLIPFVFGAEFAGSARVFALLMVATSALATFNSCAPLITAYGATWTLTFIALTSAIVNVLLNFLLIPRFGIVGSAAATALAYGLSGMLVLFVLQRRLGIRLINNLWLSLPSVAACAAYLLLDGVWRYSGTLLVLALTAMPLIWIFRLLGSENRQALSDLNIPVPLVNSETHSSEIVG